jgi:PTS system nitrogen regulatory IIA component
MYGLMNDASGSALIGFDEASRLLNVPGSTLLRWVRQGKVPCRSHGSEIVFSRSDLVHWAREHDLALSDRTDGDPACRLQQFDLLRAAITRGGIHTLAVDSRESLFEGMVAALRHATPANPKALIAAFLERESISSTALGKGVAFPHPRLSEHLSIPDAVVGLFYIEPPLPFNAPDHEPVFLAFAVLAPDNPTHLCLMAILSRFLRLSGTLPELRSRPSLDEVLALLKEPT